MRTAFGTFDQKAAGSELAHLLDEALPSRIRASAVGQFPNDLGSFAANNPTVTWPITTVPMAASNSEGAMPGRSPLRLDKQHDYWVKMTVGQANVVKICVTLQAQYSSTRGANGGILAPYGDQYSFADLRSALQESLTQPDDQAGYRPLYLGGVVPQNLSNTASEDDQKKFWTNAFDNLASRSGNKQNTDVTCTECGNSRTVGALQRELNNLQKKPKPLPCSLYCPKCNK